MAGAAAEAAGKVLRSSFGQHREIKYKGEVDIVTEADKQSEQKIKEILEESFPAYGMLAEESGELAARPAGSWIPWTSLLVTPTSYLFAVSLALEREGEAVLGWCTTR